MAAVVRRAARRRLRRCCSPSSCPPTCRWAGRGVHGGRRADGLHARAAPRARRRPHRGHRQHDAQAHDGGRPAARRRAFLRARALDGRVRPRAPARRSACGGRRAGRATTSSTLHTVTGVHRAVGVRHVPAAHRRGQPQRARSGILRAFRACAAGRSTCRGRSERATAGGPDGRVLGRCHAGGHAAVADVSARGAVRARLRHRDRGRAAVPRGRRGGRRAAVVRGPDVCRCCSPPACRCSTRSTARS